jgi:cytochrome c peroxidase
LQGFYINKKYYFAANNFAIKKQLLILSLSAAAIICLQFKKEKFEHITTKTQLGQELFNDKILSKDNSIACSSCHKPQFAFADTSAFSTGINNKPSRRNTPSILNMLNRESYFFDGRAQTLEQQALIPIQHPSEMGLPIKEALQKLNTNSKYKQLFKKIYKTTVTEKTLADAIAQFENSLETDSSKFDIWDAGEGPVQLTEQEELGRQLFIGEKAKCFDCHFGPDFTGDEFKNIGLYNGKNLNDPGRFIITENRTDLGKFKVPGLRNVALTAPYMHNGMFTTLEQVVEYYNNPKAVVPNAINTDDSLKKPLNLTQEEKDALVAFLKTLSDYRYIKN